MKKKFYYGLLLSMMTFALSISMYAQNGPRGILKAGAAKIDFTPAESELPQNSFGILDHVYSRAIVVSNGTTKAALVTADVGGVHDPIYLKVIERAEKELGIPAKNIIITSTHTHSSGRIPSDVLGEKIFASIKEADASLQPARMGYGAGESYINVNRNMFNHDRLTWWEGPNYDGISDKTVAVIYFETLEGDPIAVYYNYAMHAVVAGNLDMVSGCVPGASSRYIEESMHDQIVAVWSTGACGDQNPIFFQQTFDLRDIRIADYAARGEDISNKMPPGGTGMDRTNPKVARLMEEQKQMLLTMGQMLGEEVKHVIRNMRRFETNVAINCGNKTVSVPGRRLLNREGRAGYEGRYEDTDPVQIRLCMVMIDDIPVTSVNGEVFNAIAIRLKKESPFARTMMATVSNGGGAGYIPNDEAFGFQTFEVIGARYKPGYAESAIVNGLLDLIREATH